MKLIFSTCDGKYESISVSNWADVLPLAKKLVNCCSVLSLLIHSELYSTEEVMDCEKWLASKNDPGYDNKMCSPRIRQLLCFLGVPVDEGVLVKPEARELYEWQYEIASPHRDLGDWPTNRQDWEWVECEPSLGISLCNKRNISSATEVQQVFSNTSSNILLGGDSSKYDNLSFAYENWPSNYHLTDSDRYTAVNLLREGKKMLLSLHLISQIFNDMPCISSNENSWKLCILCCKWFKTVRVLWTHIQDEHTNYGTNCGECLSFFTNEICLVRHCLTKHKIRIPFDGRFCRRINTSEATGPESIEIGQSIYFDKTTRVRKMRAKFRCRCCAGENGRE